ncbi:MAG TPA: DUF998 domain-containing protein [Anaerolineales bacterium]|jgi:uncharacterized protein DUF998|nr:DUF998 domain-containing protein [Anaerolineales bacterium]
MMKTEDRNTLRSDRLTRALLICGVIAGPLYILLGVIQMLIRPGFDPTRHDLSLMSNGDLGWIQITNFVLTGLLTIAGAIGMWRVLHGGKGGTWGPILVAVYGLGLIGAGFFVADPALGFPPGTSADAHSISGHGLMHFVTGGIGFLALIAACFVFARMFRALKQNGWAGYSLITGMLFFAAFFGIAAGSQLGGTVLVFVTLAFTAAVVLAWSWISALSTHLLKI